MKREVMMKSEKSFQKRRWSQAVNIGKKVGYKLIWRLK
jgi:hypothetical protein